MTARHLAGAVGAGALRVTASLTLLAAAGLIGFFTLMVGMMAGGDVDYPRHPLSAFERAFVVGHLGLAFVCLLASIVPALEDPLPRPAWFGLVALVGACLFGCGVVMVVDVFPGELVQPLSVVGILACLVCGWRLATGLRPVPR
ncbi:MAG: hypothetical protein U0869_07865 [Chloroflexota bacterium]